MSEGQLLSDAHAKAIEAKARAAQKALELLEGMSGYLREVFGTVPADLVGYLGGDWLKVRRAENLLDILERAKKRMEQRGIDSPHPASLSISLPIMVAAADESREELKDLWAALLVAAADPARTGRFRNAFIDTVKRMDPLDAIVLKSIKGAPQPKDIREILDQPKSLAANLRVSTDELQVSLENLVSLRLLFPLSPASPFQTTAFGREFFNAVS